MHISRHIGRHIGFKPSESGFPAQHPSAVDVVRLSAQKGATNSFHSEKELVTSNHYLYSLLFTWEYVYL